MNKEELKEKFEKNVQFLQRNIPPDDIYIFAEQTFMAALFFLSKWNSHEDLNEVCKNDLIAKKWIVNIIGFQRCKDEDIDVDLNLNLESIED